MKILILLESPGKIKKVSSIVSNLKDGNTYIVKASMGHITRIADSGTYKLGIDLNTFEPTYEVMKEKKDIVSELKKEVKNADKVYLASDNDREGSSIAYAWINFLNIPKSKAVRILFNEITEKGIKDGIKNQTTIDENMVQAAIARAELDKIVGYRLSGLTLSKLNCESAGRVQSAALKILADRENTIKTFIPEKYFEIYLPFKKNRKQYEAQFKGTKTKKYTTIKDERECNLIKSTCDGKDYKVFNISSKERVVAPKLPFTTSTFQQDASAKLNYSPKKAMQIAQALYEAGKISYMRTDSSRLSDDFVKEAKVLIEKKYGKDYYNGLPAMKKQEGVQDAHEGIRPTHLDDLGTGLEGEELRIYKLIYNRTIAALMSSAKIQDTTVLFENSGYVFGITGHKILFKGFKAVYSDDEEEDLLPEFKLGETINAGELKIEKKETQPPTRFTEATLVKELETKEIGRPSTYATVGETLKKREYITVEKKSIVVTDKGLKLSKALDDYFSDIINVKYTAEMEEFLDEIAEGKKKRFDELKTFYSKFDPIVLKASKEMNKNKEKPEVVEGKTCPECGKGNVLIRVSKYGEHFFCCSRFPHCRWTAKMTESGEIAKSKEKSKPTSTKCPKCKTGLLIKRTSKTGEVFYGCNHYPKCKFTMKEEEYNEKFHK